MHLDDSIPAQYYHWLKNALRGDLGESMYTRRNVLVDIQDFLPATMELALFSGLIMTLFGISLGVLSARYPNTWVDNLVRMGSYVGVV
ncbi:MAG: ABC transporter permease, partial [Gammaproteobacteria bacterium]|nr:ABC transporter permease [Gammaproteobacteria bacterium]